MRRRAIFHDSKISKIEEAEKRIIITFNRILLLDVKDDFGFDLDLNQGSYCKAIIEFENYTLKGNLQPSEVMDGYVQINECRYDLLPEKLSAPKAALVLQTKMDRIRVIGENFHCSIKE